MLLLIFTLLFFAPVADAQEVGFFIPQKTLDMMNSPDKLPPLRVHRPIATNQPTARQNTGQAAPATVNNRPNTPNVVVPANSRIPRQNVALPPMARPVAPAYKPQPQQTTADNTARRKVEPQPRPADEPMVPQTGTPAIPVTADDIAGDSILTNPPPKASVAVTPNAPTAPTITPSTPTVTPNTPSSDTGNNLTPEQQDYARLIKEYEEDIKKISRSIPVENKRLNEVLQNYKDEVLILD